MKPLATMLLDLFFNSMWQVVLIWAAAAPLAHIARRYASIRLEHRIWVGALLLQSLLPVTSVLLRPSVHVLLQHLRYDTPFGGEITYTIADADATVALHRFTTFFTAIAMLYAAVLCSSVLRLVWQLAALRRLHTSSTPLPASSAMQSLADCICSQFGIAPVRCATSTTLRAPVTYGLLPPVVLLPASLASDASTATLESLLAHELAHVQRCDFAKNLLYRCATLPVGYHPLLWLTRRRVVETREMVCDAAGAELTGSRKRYANTLLHLAQSMLPRQSTPTHAIGIFESGSFERRLLMLQQKPTPLGTATRLVLLGSALVTTVGIGTAAFAFSTAPAPVIASAPHDTAQDKRVHLDSGVAAGQILTKVPPVYPKEAKAAKIQGSVVLAAVIGEDGTIQNLQVVSGPPELQTSSLDAVRQWVYKPYLVNGEPTEVDTRITINYTFGR